MTLSTTPDGSRTPLADNDAGVSDDVAEDDSHGLDEQRVDLLGTIIALMERAFESSTRNVTAPDIALQRAKRSVCLKRSFKKPKKRSKSKKGPFENSMSKK
jgi:hypothetical protein